MARPLRTMTFNEPNAVSDVLKYEDGSYSRDTVTIASGAGVLDIGTVLGKITASGKYKKHVNGATDGTEVAAAVLIAHVDATSADVLQAIVITRHAEVSRQGLKWDSSVNNQAKQDAAIAQLQSLGIVTRLGA